MDNTNNFSGNLNDDLDLSEEQAIEEIKEPTLSKKEPGSSVTISASQAKVIKVYLQNLKEIANKLSDMLSLSGVDATGSIMIGQIADGISTIQNDTTSESANIIEGVFDGEQMVGPDGKSYSVPANYASKSKLVEGDILKLTISGNGAFVYKQIGPIERRREIGVLDIDSKGNYAVVSDTGKWKILPASVTYYKGQVGDEAVVLVPKNGDSSWGALDNVVRNA